MYSFAQRSDTIVLDEPFYACYLEKTGKNHPGREEILKAQSQSESVVYQYINSLKQQPVLFIKNMAHHLEILKPDLINNSVNVFLIRNPKQIITSYAAIIENPKLQDLGVEYQWKMFKKLNETQRGAIVLDSGILLKNPSEILKKLCSEIKIEFQENMLSWSVGPKPYDGIWAKYWYSNVHKSNGFEGVPNSAISVPAHLRGLQDEAIRYYENLLPFAINLGLHPSQKPKMP